MYILQMLLGWCCRMSRWSPLIVGSKDARCLHDWVLLLETSHNILTGGRLADKKSQDERERVAERDRNIAIRRICSLLLRDKGLGSVREHHNYYK